MAVNGSARPWVSDWLALQPGGSILVRSGRVELGQGILTALAQIAADELDVSVDRVRVMSASAPDGLDEGFTSGSKSVMEGGARLRRACAQARAMLLEAAARQLQVPAAELHVRDGAVRDRAGTVRTTYWALADTGVLNTPVSENWEVKPPTAHRVVGVAVPRLDLAAKLTGEGAYIQDLVLPGMLFGRTIRPPTAGCRLMRCDKDAVVPIRSVVAVVRQGTFLGVLAEREEDAVRAAELLRSRSCWSDPPGHLDASSLQGLLRGQPTDDVVWARTPQPSARRGAATSFSASYSRPYLAHASITPSCAVARWHDGRLEVWTHAQGVFPLQRALAAIFAMPPERVQVRHVASAGCYGHNGADDAACDAALLARAVPGRPVQVTWSRADEFRWESYGPAMTADITVGLDSDGDIIQWVQDVWGSGHSTRPGAGGQPNLLGAREAADDLAPWVAQDPPMAQCGGTGRNAVPGYAIPELSVTTHRVLTPLLRTSSLRGLGAMLNVYAIECTMDELARLAAADPIDYRLRHLTDDRARAVLEAVADLSGWPNRGTSEQDASGWGAAYARYKNSGGYCAVVARVTATDRVRVTHLYLAVDVGQIINPDGVLNQVEGGAIQAASWAVGEEVRLGATGVRSIDWESYPIMRFSETPEVAVRLLPRPDASAVGVGEIAVGPVAGAIGNALADALGLRIPDLPFSAERIAATLSAVP